LEDANVAVNIFDVLGARVYPLIDKEAGPGVGAVEIKEMEAVLSGVVGCGLILVLEWFL
jgi:hypothetical protein